LKGVPKLIFPMMEKSHHFLRYPIIIVRQTLLARAKRPGFYLDGTHIFASIDVINPMQNFEMSH